MTSLPQPTAFPQYTWRPMQRADLPAFHQILRDSQVIDDREFIEALADMENTWEDPWCNAQHDSLVALTPAGQLIASVRSFVNPDPTAELTAEAWFEIHPAHRGLGLERFLQQWVEARGTERLRAKAGPGPRRIRTGTADNLPWRIELYEQLAYQPVRYFYRMGRDLTQPVPAPTLPPGFTFSQYQPELDVHVYEAFEESFSDHWGHQPITHAEWQQFFIQRSTFRPQLSWLVLNGGEVVAFSMNREEQDARHNTPTGWIGQVGTRRAWRKQGLATALLCQSMQSFKTAGYTQCGLGVDTANPTGALAIYERLGFAPARRYITFEKELA